MRRSLAALFAAGILASLAVAPATAATPAFQVVASGLHSPRGLAFGPGGGLYVAEAGSGGAGGFGLTGSVSEILGASTDHATVRTILSGLPSAGDVEGVVGPDGVSVQGKNPAWEWTEGRITMESTRSRIVPTSVPGRKG